MKGTVLVTGSSSGIGKETAKFFADNDWNVSATMRNPEKRKTSLKGMKNVELFHLDVTDKKSIKDAVKSTIERFGKIDVLVNNAGYGAFGPFEAAGEDQIRRQFDTNLFGLMDVTREILPHMKENKSGVIINISSVGGKIGFPAYSLYNGSKFALEGFSECLRYELSYFGIKVKLVQPGPIKTDFDGRSRDYIDDSGKLGDDYKKFMNKMNTATKKSHEKAAGPGEVAKVIYRAATDNGNKLHYPAGKGAGTLMIARKLLPDRLMYYIVRKVALG